MVPSNAVHQKVSAPMESPQRPQILSLGSYGESLRIGQILRSETVGAALLLAATVIAMVSGLLNSGRTYRPEF